MNLRIALVGLGLCLLCIGAGPKLAISEIQYDPKSDESEDQQTEWVEIHNYGDDAVNLKGYQITTGSKTRPHDARRRFPIGDITIDAGQYVVIGVGKKECYEGFGLPDFAAYIGEDHYAWFNNDGGSIAIRDSKNKIIDEVIYKAESPWPVVRNSGSSIQLVVPDGEDPKEANDSPENWVASNSTNSDSFKDHGRGTPGEAIKEKKKSATTKPVVARSAKAHASRK